MAANKFDWDKFNQTINYLKAGIKTLYFRDVIFSATSKSIIPFEEKTIKIINIIKKSIQNDIDNFSNEIESKDFARSNELGNFIEKRIKEKITSLEGLSCQTPSLINGKAQSSGYPDCLIRAGDLIMYADIKVYNTKNLTSSLRSFYYQPTNKIKILYDAPHCLISFEVKGSGSKENKSPFKIINFKIIDLYNLEVKFKAEFNTNNPGIYRLNNF